MQPSIDRTIETTKMSSKKFCTACGSEVSIGHAFCGSCGGALTSDENPDTTQESRSGDSNSRTVSSNSLIRIGKWILVAIVVLFAISLASSFVRQSLSSDETTDMTKVVDVQARVNSAGLPVAERILDIQNCSALCADEFQRFRQTLIPYEVTLTDAVLDLNSINAPQEYRAFVTNYRDVLQLRLDATRLYIQGIDPLGRNIDERILLLADDKWAESQLKLRDVVRSLEEILR